MSDHLIKSYWKKWQKKKKIQALMTFVCRCNLVWYLQLSKYFKYDFSVKTYSMTETKEKKNKKRKEQN